MVFGLIINLTFSLGLVLVSDTSSLLSHHLVVSLYILVVFLASCHGSDGLVWNSLLICPTGLAGKVADATKSCDVSSASNKNQDFRDAGGMLASVPFQGLGMAGDERVRQLHAMAENKCQCRAGVGMP